MSKKTPKRLVKSNLNHGERGVFAYLDELGFGRAEDQIAYLQGSPRPLEPVVIYHQQHGNANPDFTLYRDGLAVGVIEVEDILFDPDRDRQMGVIRTSEPQYKRAQRKIRDAARQLEGVSGLPSMIIVRDAGHTLSCSPLMIQSLVFGWPQVRFQVGSKAQTEPECVFGDDGKFSGKENRARNAHVSAMAWYRKRDVAYAKLGVDDALAQASRHAPRDASVGDLLDRMMPVIERVQRMGVQEDVQHSFLIILNPWASMPWPRELWGPNDQVYEVNLRSGQPELIHDGLAATDPIAMPASQAQTDLDALLDDPNLRND